MAFGIGSKIKKGLGSIANKVADKLIPKELAPFLPMLAPLFMGPGAGLMSRYLVPQLLTALSTGKTTGGISGTSQGLAGLASFLSDPSRFKLGQKEIAATAEQGPKNLVEIDKTKLDPNFLESDLIDPSLRGDFSQQVNPDLDFGKMAPSRPRRSIYDATGGGLRQSPAVVTTPNPNYIPGTEASLQNIYNISDLDRKAGIMDYLKVGANEARDFIQGTNIANKRPFGEEVTVEEGSKLIGKGKFDPYNQSYNEFKKNPLDTYAVGDAINVQDAGFGYNMPRRAVQQGLLSTGPGMAVANKMKADADAEEAAQQAAFDNYYDSRQALFDYFGNAKPNYGMLYGGFANGGNVDSKRGLVDGPGGYAGDDDIDDIIRKLLLDGIDFSKAGGGNPPSIVGGTDFKKRKLPKGMKVIRSIKPKKAEGGIMNAAPGMPQGMQVDGRNGTFIPMGVEEKADDVPAMLSKNEFVMTADAVRAAGGGSVEKGAQRMYDLMNSLEARA